MLCQIQFDECVGNVLCQIEFDECVGNVLCQIEFNECVVFKAGAYAFFPD